MPLPYGLQLKACETLQINHLRGFLFYLSYLKSGMRTDVFIGFFDVVIFLGVFQGLFISWFFIKNGVREHRANLYQGILLLALVMAMSEEWLNNTGLIVRVLPISNYAEWLNFAFGPLFFLYVKYNLKQEGGRRDWMHFVIAGFWLLNLSFYFMQSPEFKYNSYVYVKHPDWPTIEAEMIFTDNPLGIRLWTNHLTGIHFIAYIVAAMVIFRRKLQSTSERFFKVKDENLKVIRNSIYHFSVIIIIFLIVKLTFEGDIGDYFISSYISFMIFATSYQVLSQSRFFIRPHSFMEFPTAKYLKSSLSEENKDAIMTGIKAQMEAGYFKNNMASLADLAGKLHETTHHVSQVINEKFGESFYELLARLRVDEAKRLLGEDTGDRITIEDLADRVGYNSKSSLNRTFKNQTGLTPSEFRDSLK